MFDRAQASAPLAGTLPGESTPTPAADDAARAAAAAAAASPTGMIGDVNLFLLGNDEAAMAGHAWAARARPTGAEEAAATASADAAAAPEKAPRAAEVMVMVAEPAARRRGFAAEAVELMLGWAVRVLGIGLFVAKISEDNAASLALFSRLGFVEAARVPAFREVHLVRGGGGATTAGTAFELLPLPPPAAAAGVPGVS